MIVRMDRFSSTFHVVYENDCRNHLQDDVHAVFRLGLATALATQAKARDRSMAAFVSSPRGGRKFRVIVVL
jgi:hypothetical protein